MRLHLPFTAAALALLAPAALTQDQTIGDLEPPPGPPNGQQAPDFPFTRVGLEGGYFHQFNVDVKDGGSFDRDRFVINFGGRTQLDRKAGASYSVGYRLDDYDFDGASALGADPWDQVNVLTAGGIFTWQHNDDWTIFGGPFVQSSWESGADIDRGFQGGGMIGASYRFSENLELGFGGGLTTQIEDDIRFFPVLVVDWKINDNWSVVNAPNYTGFSRQSFELAYDLGDPDYWLLAFGGSYERNRFRLDDEGPAPRGVGEDTAFNLWVRLVYRPTPKLAITGIVGATLEGDLRLENDTGGFIGNRGYENGIFVGIAGRITF